MRRRNLKNKLFMLFVLIGITPLIIILVLGGVSRVSEMERVAREEMWTKTAAVDNHITDLLNTNLYVLNTVAYMPTIQSYLETKSPEEKLVVGETLKNTNEIFRDKNLMALTDSTGVQLIRTDNRPVVDISRREHFQRAMSGENFVSNAMKSMATGDMIVVIASPVKNKANVTIGMVQRNFPLSTYRNFVDSLTDVNSSIILMDREGQVLAQSNKHLLGDSDDSFTIPTQFVSKAMSGVFGVTRVEVNGVDSMVSYRRNAATGWPIVIVKPYSQLLARVNEELFKLAVFGLVCVTMISLAAYRFSGQTVKPLQEFLSVAKKAAKGESTDGGVVASTDDEVEEIAEAFNAIRSSRDSYMKETERDTLTGLYTKAAVEAICEKKLERFSDPDQNYGSIAFYIVDLDNFKEVNKTYGRLFGDRVLLEFAQKLRRLFRPLDCVGRIEGDEFIAVVDQVSDAEEIMEKAKHVIEMASNIEMDDQPVDISTCVGVAFFPQNGQDYESVLRAAKQAISVAKSKGKGSFHSFAV